MSIISNSNEFHNVISQYLQNEYENDDNPGFDSYECEGEDLIFVFKN